MTLQRYLYFKRNVKNERRSLSLIGLFDKVPITKKRLCKKCLVFYQFSNLRRRFVKIYEFFVNVSCIFIFLPLKRALNIRVLHLLERITDIEG